MAHWPNWLRFVLLGMVLAPAAVIDIRTGRVPNWLTLPSIALGLVVALAVGLSQNGALGMKSEMENFGFGLLAGLVPAAVVFFIGALGGGDVKLMAAVGAISASWTCAIETCFNAVALAAIMAIIVMVYRGQTKRTFQRIMGYFLLLGLRNKPSIPDDGPRVPVALAIAIGGMLAAMRALKIHDLPWPFLNGT